MIYMVWNYRRHPNHLDSLLMECGQVADMALCCTAAGYPSYVFGSVSEGVKCRLQVAGCRLQVAG